MDNDKKTIEKLEKEIKGNKLLLGATLVAGICSGAFASGDSFGDLFNTFKDWLTGNLGKLLSLLGFAGTFIVYMMTHRSSILFTGIVISLIAGGLVGISDTFFNVGTASFTSH